MYQHMIGLCVGCIVKCSRLFQDVIERLVSEEMIRPKLVCFESGEDVQTIHCEHRRQ